jgi:hypothetical protein
MAQCMTKACGPQRTRSRSRQGLQDSASKIPGKNLSSASRPRICTSGQVTRFSLNAIVEWCVFRNTLWRDQKKGGKTSMAATRILTNCNAFSSRGALIATDLQFSNRQLPLLESSLSHCKQTTAIDSNRQLLRGRLFRAATPSENGIQNLNSRSFSQDIKSANRCWLTVALEAAF